MFNLEPTIAVSRVCHGMVAAIVFVTIAAVFIL